MYIIERKPANGNKGSHNREHTNSKLKKEKKIRAREKAYRKASRFMVRLDIKGNRSVFNTISGILNIKRRKDGTLSKMSA